MIVGTLLRATGETAVPAVLQATFQEQGGDTTQAGKFMGEGNNVLNSSVLYNALWRIYADFLAFEGTAQIYGYWAFFWLIVPLEVNMQKSAVFSFPLSMTKHPVRSMKGEGFQRRPLRIPLR